MEAMSVEGKEPIQSICLFEHASYLIRGLKMAKTHSLEVLLDLQVELMLKFSPEPQNNIEMCTKERISSMFRTKVTISFLKVVLSLRQPLHPVHSG